MMSTKGLTKMVVRVAENERKKLEEVKAKQKQVELEKFLVQIKEKKADLVSNSKRKRSGVSRSCGMGQTNVSESSGSGLSGSIKLEPRHFKKKEGAVWLNMFETISRN